VLTERPRLTTANTPVKLLVFAASAALTYLVFYWLSSPRVAIALVASVTLHEIGHWAVFRHYGYKSTLVFFPGLGAGTIPNDTDKVKEMGYYENAMVSITGPLVNVGLALIGLLAAIRPDWYTYGMTFAVVNMLLAAFNLMPLMLLDGGHFIRCIYCSLDDDGDRKVTQWLIVSLGLLAVLTILIGGLPFFLLIALIGITKKSRFKPDEWQSTKAMKPAVAHKWVRFYVVLLIGSGIATLVLPNLKKV
jgi:hypothetical protein